MLRPLSNKDTTTQTQRTKQLLCFFNSPSDPRSRHYGEVSTNTVKQFIRWMSTAPHRPPDMSFHYSQLLEPVLLFKLYLLSIS